MAKVQPRNAPMGITKAMQIADKIVKSIRNVLNIAVLFIYYIYCITRARVKSIDLRDILDFKILQKNTKKVKKA